MTPSGEYSAGSPFAPFDRAERAVADDCPGKFVKNQ
jgi:hypothetical protein